MNKEQQTILKILRITVHQASGLHNRICTGGHTYITDKNKIKKILEDYYFAGLKIEHYSKLLLDTLSAPEVELQQKHTRVLLEIESKMLSQEEKNNISLG